MFNRSGKRLYIYNIQPQAFQQKERLESCMCALQGQCLKANDGYERLFQFPMNIFINNSVFHSFTD